MVCIIIKQSWSRFRLVDHYLSLGSLGVPEKFLSSCKGSNADRIQKAL
jgi:hypothetical protein